MYSKFYAKCVHEFEEGLENIFFVSLSYKIFDDIRMRTSLD